MRTPAFGRCAMFTLTGGVGMGHEGTRDSAVMKLSRVAVIALSVLALVAGAWLGLMPIKASMTQISPELRILSVSCGNGYLGAGLPVHPGNLVEIPGAHPVYLPKADYDTHCGDAVGWRRYAAWALTGLGALGLAMTLAAGRTSSSTGSLGSSGSGSAGSSKSAGSSGGSGSSGSGGSESSETSGSSGSAGAEGTPEPSGSSSGSEPEASESGSSEPATSSSSTSSAATSEVSRSSGRAKGGAHRARSSES
jgi:hypothetical protein